jgi:prepilin-type N-terminal cleavage/methylation domain-containing protein
MRATTASRGFTLIEMMVSVAILGIIVSLAVQAAIVIDRGRRPREITAQMQGEGRTGLSYVEADLRAAALGAGTGVVWAEKGGNAVRRPAVQIVEDVVDDGFLEAKPGTDALLVVRAWPGERSGAALAADVAQTNLEFPVTRVVDDGADPPEPIFSRGDHVLVGEYGDAVWVPLGAVDEGTRTLTPELAVNVLPGEHATSVARGGPVRRAIARLYYVNKRDELRRVELAVPRLPETQAEVLSNMDVARNVENLQIDCAVQAGLDLGACPGVLGAGAEVTDEAKGFGTFAGGGARLDATRVSALRTVTLSVVVRSPDLAETSGPFDAPIAVGGVTLEPGGASAEGHYLRRAYQIGVAVRNTSLESM